MEEAFATAFDQPEDSDVQSAMQRTDTGANTGPVSFATAADRLNWYILRCGIFNQDLTGCIKVTNPDSAFRAGLGTKQ